MLGSVGLGRRESGAHGLAEWCATLAAELLSRGNGCAARLARYGKANSALTTEPLPCGRFRPAPWTRHVGASEKPGTVSRGYGVEASRVKDTVDRRRGRMLERML